MKPKRNPSNTVDSVVKAHVAAALPDIEAPKHVRLREQDAPFWMNIIRSRAREEWCDTDLVIGAQLARCQADIEIESERLDSEGSVIENNRGTPVMNPRHAVLEQLARRELALMRALGLAGHAAKPQVRDVEKARRAERDARAVRDEVTEDDLLA